MVKAKKELGQNFLICKEKIIAMVNALELEKNDLVFEIGPGKGAVTEMILNRELVETLIAIELDQDMVSYLNRALGDSNNALQIINTNVLDYLPKITLENFKIIGSLPYYITSPILHKIIYMENHPNHCVLLVQKEVAQKVFAKNPKSSYLSAFMQSFFEVEYIDTIDKTCFDPIPKVDGGILKFIKIPEPKISKEELVKYEGFLHKAYSNPRKMLNKVFNSEELKLFNLDGNARAQNISTNTWIEAFNKTLT